MYGLVLVQCLVHGLLRSVLSSLLGLLCGDLPRVCRTTSFPRRTHLSSALLDHGHLEREDGAEDESGRQQAVSRVLVLLDATEGHRGEDHIDHVHIPASTLLQVR